MQKIMTFLIAMICVQVNAQSFIDPGDELDCNQPFCPPILAMNDPLMDSMTEAAGAVGKALQGDPCADYTYAHQATCWFFENVADVVACMYPASTPQGSVCKDGDQPKPDDPKPEEPNPNEPNPDEPNEPDSPPPPPPPTSDDPQNESYYATSHTRPVVSKISSDQALFLSKQLNKLELGKKFYPVRGGFYLVPIRAERSSKNPNEWIIVYRLMDAKGRTIGNPILMSRNGFLIVWDIAKKSKR